jgi:predicted RNA-binding protein with PIN domain
MAVLVDGYNVIFADEELADAMRCGRTEQAREGLVARLTQYQALSGEPVIVVFDGTVDVGLPADGRAAVKILYSRSPQKADEVLREILDTAPNPRGLTVVSTDREIRKAAKAKRAKPVLADAFLKEMERLFAREEDAPPPEPGEKYGQPISRNELRQWLKIFGEGR